MHHKEGRIILMAVVDLGMDKKKHFVLMFHLSVLKTTSPHLFLTPHFDLTQSVAIVWWNVLVAQISSLHTSAHESFAAILAQYRYKYSISCCETDFGTCHQSSFLLHGTKRQRCLRPTCILACILWSTGGLWTSMFNPAKGFPLCCRSCWDSVQANIYTTCPKSHILKVVLYQNHFSSFTSCLVIPSVKACVQNF